MLNSSQGHRQPEGWLSQQQSVPQIQKTFSYSSLQIIASTIQARLHSNISKKVLIDSNFSNITNKINFGQSNFLLI
jgi:ABC-type cobalamin transport system ATPase subunit